MGFPAEDSISGRLMKYPNTGIVFALTIISLWIRTLAYALFEHELSYKTTPFVSMILIHLYTGLFITAHDSIHGTISKTHQWINYYLGKLCLLSFAGFDYDMMREEHWKHHSHAGLVG